MEKGNFKSFDEAYKAVQGTRTMLVMKFKPFLETGFGIDDLFSVADEGIFRAWKEWKPEESKFNTFAFNHMSWALNDHMNDMNSRFKINAITTYELTREGESFKEVKAVGKTKNAEFNAENNLDGSEESKMRINRDIFNSYVAFQTSIRRPYYVINAGAFASDDSEDFDIMDTASECSINGDTTFSCDDFSMSIDDMESEMETLDNDKKRVAQMIIAGVSVNEMAKEFGITKNRFMQKFAPESSGTKGKAKMAKEQQKLDFLAGRKAKREAASA